MLDRSRQSGLTGGPGQNWRISCLHRAPVAASAILRLPSAFLLHSCQPLHRVSLPAHTAVLVGGSHRGVQQDPRQAVAALGTAAGALRGTSRSATRMSCNSVLVAVKLHSKDSQGTMQYVLRNLVDTRRDSIHVLCVVLQKETREEQRQQAQQQLRQQYGQVLRGCPHKLHIIRVIHSGTEGDKASAAAYIARAICAKASLLQSNVIVVGGKVRPSALLPQRSSAVADAVRRHSRQPVLLINDEHPLLAAALPSIAEEPFGACEALPAHLACVLQPSAQPSAQPSLGAQAHVQQALVCAGAGSAGKAAGPRSGAASKQRVLQAC